MPIKASGETLKQFNIVGRKLPTPKDPKPTLHQMQIFASNHVVAKSRFWYFTSMLRRVKKTHGEIISCEEVFEKKPGSVKNFGIWLRYDSRTGHHNMYREYRDVTIAGAVTQAYRDMGARHRAQADRIQIIKVQPIKTEDCKRPNIKQFHDSKIKFPLPHRVNAKRRNLTPSLNTMASNTGVKLNDDCVTAFNDFKLRKAYSYLVFKLSDDLTQIVIEHKGAPGADYTEFVKCLPDNDCRYAVVTVSYSTPSEGDRTKIVFFLWAPESSKVKSKMLYAGSKDTAKKGFNGIQTEVQGTDKSEVEFNAVIEKCKQFSQ